MSPGGASDGSAGDTGNAGGAGNTGDSGNAAPESAMPAASSVVRAAGGVVVRASASGGWDVAIVHRPLQQDWSLPKGKVDPGESAQECALREVLEETGWKCSLGRFVGEVEYIDRKGRPKIVEYWLMQPIEGGYPLDGEVDDLTWVPLAEASARLTYDHDATLVASVAGAPVERGRHLLD
ncbi:MAG: NUDIX hydrolase [Acidimicrobiales bacterium]